MRDQSEELDTRDQNDSLKKNTFEQSTQVISYIMEPIFFKKAKKFINM
jgi:hypothetical protein